MRTQLVNYFYNLLWKQFFKQNHVNPFDQPAVEEVKV